MSKLLNRLLCRHVMCWSDRRQGDVCYKCGKFRSARTTRVMQLPDRDFERTITIRFPVTAAPEGTPSMSRFSHPRTARD